MILIFLGPPGVGKGTYASRLGKKVGISHISTGDIFRREIKKSSGIGMKVKQFLDKGEMVPDDVVIDVLKERIKEPDCEKGFILDGVPRTIEQAEIIDESIKIDAVINFILADKILTQKILARRTCRNCGDIYNIIHIKSGDIDMPPIPPKKEGICDKCGGELYQRSDETEEVIKNRLEVYRKQTEPLIKYYRNKSLVRDVKVNREPVFMVAKLLEVIKDLL